MHDQELRDELLGNLSRPEPRFNRRQIIAAGAILFLGLYIGNILFGTNSVLRLLELQDQSRALQGQEQYLSASRCSREYLSP